MSFNFTLVDMLLQVPKTKKYFNLYTNTRFDWFSFSDHSFSLKIYNALHKFCAFEFSIRKSVLKNFISQTTFLQTVVYEKNFANTKLSNTVLISSPPFFKKNDMHDTRLNASNK